ncbi:MAG: hypothetical protein AAB573_01735 [Patescibacteria group bacterium]
MNEYMVRLGDKLARLRKMWGVEQESCEDVGKMIGSDYPLGGVPVSQRVETAKKNLKRIEEFADRVRREMQKR